ncbi:MAG: hypothetical protein VW877_16170 [Pseudomonadaceae bacterium]
MTKKFKPSHPDYFDLIVDINWSSPTPYDELAGHADDDSAYFYAVVAHENEQWTPYYIGLVWSQTASVRHKNSDHKSRRERLKKLYPDLEFKVALGVPDLDVKDIKKGVIEKLEGLLIYSQWNPRLDNTLKIERFYSDKHILIRNTGFNAPFDTEIGFGVFGKK